MKFAPLLISLLCCASCIFIDAGDKNTQETQKVGDQLSLIDKLVQAGALKPVEQINEQGIKEVVYTFPAAAQPPCGKQGTDKKN